MKKEVVLNFKEKLEQKVKEFFDAWIKHDFHEMLKHTTLTYRAYHVAQNIKDWYDRKHLIEYKIIKSIKIVDAMYDITVEIHYKIGNLRRNKLVTTRAICEKQPFDASVNGTWGVNPISVLKEKKIAKKKKIKEKKNETN